MRQLTAIVLLPGTVAIAVPALLVRLGGVLAVVGTMLAGQALFFRSWAIAVERFVFGAVNALYFPLVEEPGLSRRFGVEYEEYRARVPRWLPRVRL